MAHLNQTVKSKIKSVIKNVFIFIIITPSFALAAGNGSNMLTQVLNGLINFLTSTPARLMLILSIIAVVYGTLALGKIPKERAIASVIGIGIVFSASYIASQMGLGG